MCQPLLSPVAPIRAPEWERLWITHLYPLKASEAGGEEEEKEGERRGGGGCSREAIGQHVQMGFSPDM